MAANRLSGLAAERALDDLRERLREALARANDMFHRRCRDLDITQIPPATGHMREVQLACVGIMDRIKAAFDRHQIRYWLDFGTLLGAVRHGGFVPWDDDIDISVLRDDFERARPILKEAFEGTPYRVRECGESHFQLRIMSVDNGIGVDIFPVDAATDAVATADEAAALNARVLAACRQLTVDCARSRAFERNFARVQARIAELTDAARGGAASSTSPYLFYAIDYPHGQKSLLLRRDDVFPLGEIAFEGRAYSCPHNPEAYLRAQYGDYLSFPRTFFHFEDASEENTELLSLRKQIRKSIHMKFFEKIYNEQKFRYEYRLLGIRIRTRCLTNKAIVALNWKLDEVSARLDAMETLFATADSKDRAAEKPSNL